jgi:enterochelin esterase-like enzyme
MIIHTRIESPHLAGNLLGDPSERDLFVYVPPGYEESDRRYPTAYLFHAYGVTAAQEVTPATDGQRWSPPIEDVLDPVFGRMGVPPMIVVIPDGWSRWGCGQWVDSPVTGNFEQYVLHDVIPYVDGVYRTLPTARSRGALGFSSGAFGSWNLASRNPDVFGAMAVLSADSWLDMTHKVMLYKYLDQHLAGTAERSRRGQLLVGDRLRLRRHLIHPIQTGRRTTSTFPWPIPAAS